MASFEMALPKTLELEGGYSNNLLDSGGATQWGITVAEARAWGYNGDMRDFPLETAKRIYKARYWDAMSLDLIADQDVAEKMFDCGVNMGTTVSKVFAQVCCNVLNRRQLDWKDIKIDGQIGPNSVETINKAVSIRKKTWLKLFNAMQGHRYAMLCLTVSEDEKNLLIKLNELAVQEMKTDKNEVFLVGWLNNRIH